MDRYARQIVLPELGPDGQARLSQARLLCVGAGGLGAPALLYCAAAGIGQIGVVDDDVVDITNLQRQILYTEGDAGQPKAQVAAARLRALNSSLSVKAHAQRLTAANALGLLVDYDIILDGTDNFASKFLLNDACVKADRPLISASILGFEAQLGVFWASRGPCYRCLYPQPPQTATATCAEAGVIGALAGVVGSTQALEAIKLALGLDWCVAHGLSPLLGAVWTFNAKTMDVRRLVLMKNPHCVLCAEPGVSVKLEDPPLMGHAVPYETLSATQAAQRLGCARFIDVREEKELAHGMIDGALHLPLGRLLENDAVLADVQRSAPVVLYCQHGVRSQRAAAHLAAQGFTSVAHLAGGYAAWTNPHVS